MISRRRLYIAVSVLLGLIVLVAAAAVLVTVAFPPPDEPFTEFYILGAGGTAAGYPEEFAAGEPQTVVVGIVSHEHETTNYRIDVELDGSAIASVGPIVLDPMGKYEAPLEFTANSTGWQKLSFLLYKNDRPDVYRSLYLWVTVGS